MKKNVRSFVAVVAIFFVFTSPAVAQLTGSWLIGNGLSPGASSSIIPVNSNDLLLASYSSYSYDSSYVTMAWLDPNMNVYRHKEFRLQYPLNFVFQTVKCPGGFLIGTLEYGVTGTPLSLIRTDTAGNVLRYDLSTSNPDYQEKIIQLVANNNGSFSGYTSISSLGTCIYRIEGNLADSLFYTKKITSAITNNAFRPFNVLDLNGNGTHLLSGTINDFAAGNRNALLLKLDSSTVYWGKSYDFSAQTTDEAYKTIRLANGNFAFVSQGGSTVGGFPDGFVTVADSNGNNVWSKKLNTNPGAFYPSALVETANHDLLVYGNDISYKGICLKFDATGTLIWQKKMTGAVNPTGFTDAIRKSNNQIVAIGNSGAFLVMQSSAEGDNCMLTDDASVIITDVTPVVTDVDFNMNPVVVNFTAVPVKPRNLTVTPSVMCTSNSIAETSSLVLSVTVFPNPAADICYLSSSDNLLVDYALFDLPGRKLIVGNFTGETSISLTALPSGIYFLHFYKNGKEEIQKIVH